MGLQDDMKTLLAMDAQAQKETFTPSHPFTPDVVAWAETTAGFEWDDEIVREAAHQILVETGREEPRFVRVPHIGEAS